MLIGLAVGCVGRMHSATIKGTRGSANVTPQTIPTTTRFPWFREWLRLQRGYAGVASDEGSPITRGETPTKKKKKKKKKAEKEFEVDEESD